MATTHPIRTLRGKKIHRENGTDGVHGFQGNEPVISNLDFALCADFMTERKFNSSKAYNTSTRHERKISRLDNSGIIAWIAKSKDLLLPSDEW